MTVAPHDSWELAVEACLDGEVTPTRDDAVRRHLEECPDCDHHAAVLLAVRDSLRRVVSRLPPLAPGRLERLAQHFRRP